MTRIRQRGFGALCIRIVIYTVLIIHLSGCVSTVESDQTVINDNNVILTPRPGPRPRINGPKVYGCRPGRPFIYRIPCTGKRPISFNAEQAVYLSNTLHG